MAVRMRGYWPLLALTVLFTLVAAATAVLGRVDLPLGAHPYP